MGLLYANLTLGLEEEGKKERGEVCAKRWKGLNVSVRGSAEER